LTQGRVFLRQEWEGNISVKKIAQLRAKEENTIAGSGFCITAFCCVSPVAFYKCGCVRVTNIPYTHTILNEISNPEKLKWIFPYS